jgi:beta-lactamase class D
MKAFVFLAMAGLGAFPAWAEFPADAVILETSEEGETLLLSGKEVELDVLREPASTFKTVIAWAALDRGLVKDVESPLPGAEGENLRLALQKSLNPPFDLLAVELGGELLGEYAKRSGLIQGTIPARWMEGKEKEARHGADLMTTIRREHQVAVAWMKGEAPWNSEAGQKLQEALLWKAAEKPIRAKTGTYGGSVWVTGYGPGKAVTVWLPGGIPRRPEALKIFFGRWNIPVPAL